MKNHNHNSDSVESKFARRTFLGAAAGALGATALSVAPSTAIAKSIDKIHPGLFKPSLALHFWDGLHFVPAESLRAGDPSLSAVKVSMTSVGSGELIRSIDAHFGGGVFHALRPAPHGAGRVQFTAATLGLKLTAHTRGESLECALQTGANAGAKLREGGYVLASANADLSGMELVSERRGSAVKSKESGDAAPFEHVVVMIERV